MASKKITSSPPQKKRKTTGSAVAAPTESTESIPPKVVQDWIYRELNPDVMPGKVKIWEIMDDNSLQYQEGTWDYAELGRSGDSQFKNLQVVAAGCKSKDASSYAARKLVNEQIAKINDDQLSTGGYYTTGYCPRCYGPAEHGMTLEECDEQYESWMDPFSSCCDGCA